MTDNEKLLVAAAYRAAAEAVNEVMPHNKYEDQSYEYVAAVKKLTTADAEKALRKFGMEIINTVYEDPCLVKSFEEIIDEVMKK
jgi:hypothetical protein